MRGAESRQTNTNAGGSASTYISLIPSLPYFFRRQQWSLPPRRAFSSLAEFRAKYRAACGSLWRFYKIGRTALTDDLGTTNQRPANEDGVGRPFGAVQE